MIWLVLTLVGQPLTAMSSPCSMMGPMSGMDMDMEGMDHSAHAMSMDSDDGGFAGSCCDDVCTLLNCLSPAIFISPSQHFAADLFNLANSHSSAFYLKPELSSLNRPPISR